MDILDCFRLCSLVLSTGIASDCGTRRKCCSSNSIHKIDKINFLRESIVRVNDSAIYLSFESAKQLAHTQPNTET